ERAVYLLDVEVDHFRLVLRHREARLNRIDPELLGGRIDGLASPTVEYGILADDQRESAAQLLERTYGRHLRSTGLLGGRAQPPLREAHKHQSGADRGGAEPVERL